MYVVILQHPKEHRKKCTLEPLRGRPEFRFLTVRPGFRYDATGHLLLAVGAPELTPTDALATAEEADQLRTHLPLEWLGEPVQRPLLLLDSTWRYLPGLRAAVIGQAVERALPTWLHTAYPRRSKDGSDPAAGLASVEALYAATRLLGDPQEVWLEKYHWRTEFLSHWPALKAGK